MAVYVRPCTSKMMNTLKILNWISTNYGSYSCILLSKQTNISLQVPPEGISFSVNSTSGREKVITLQSGNLFTAKLDIFLTFMYAFPILHAGYHFIRE